MSSQPKTFLTPEEYLEIERQSDTKHEYFNGVMFAMSGGSSRHAIVIGNITGELRHRLRDKSRVVCASDLRLRVTATGLYTYPDVMVICGDVQHADSRSDTVLNPILLVEVLSPSTKDYDRADKFEQYRTLPTLIDYLTVAQDKPHVEHWTRGTDNHGSFAEYNDINDTIRLTSIGVDLPLSEIYLKIDFTPGS